MLGVVALGNPLRGDDGLGVRLLEALREQDLPDDVDLYDAGTGGMRVIHKLADVDDVILIDVVQFDGDPGEFVWFSPDEVESIREEGSSHDPNLFEAIELSRRLDEAPDRIRCLGVEPDDLSVGEGLSEPVEAAMPTLLDSLETKIDELAG
ncbi:MAG: hydrogenase maturation protease [Halobacteriales archaeon]|jgi:hydrogenase maturation protease